MYDRSVEERGAELKRLADRFEVPPGVLCPSHEDLVSSLQELANAHERDIALDTSGRSREERELICVRVGRGARVIAVTGGAHSDEPAGSATCLALTRNLLENPAFSDLLRRFTFLIHPMVDPDGAARNARWSLEPYEYRRFLMHNYRNNDMGEDCEHGMPVSAGQEIRPEMAFLARNAREHKGRIDFYITLHTTHRLGGGLFLISEQAEDEARMAALASACEAHELPIADLDTHGEQGVEYVRPGFLRLPSMAKLAEHYQDQPEILARMKMTTYEFMERECGCPFALISELPSMVDERMRATGETDVLVADLRRAEIELGKTHVARLPKALEELQRRGVAESNPWLRQLVVSARDGPAGLQALEKSLENLAGVRAREYDIAEHEHEEDRLQLGYHKTWIKCLEDLPGQADLLRDHMRGFDAAYESILTRMDLRTVPLETQIRIQVAMVLAGT